MTLLLTTSLAPRTISQLPTPPVMLSDHYNPHQAGAQAQAWGDLGQDVLAPRVELQDWL